MESSIIVESLCYLSLSMYPKQSRRHLDWLIWIVQQSNESTFSVSWYRFRLTSPVPWPLLSLEVLSQGDELFYLDTSASKPLFYQIQGAFIQSAMTNLSDIDFKLALSIWTCSFVVTYKKKTWASLTNKTRTRLMFMLVACFVLEWK